MAITENLYTGNGTTTNYSFTFPYISETDVKVSLDAVDTTAYTFANATTIQFNTAPADGVNIRIYRLTDDSELSAEFYSGSAIRAQDLNDNFIQNLYVTQETRRDVADAVAGQIPDGAIGTSKLADGAVTDIKVTNIGSAKTTFTQSGTGAVQRTVESKLQDVVSVKDFGAVGDGVTDDTDAIQAAITAAANGTLEFNQNLTYKLTSSVSISSPLRIIGNNANLISTGHHTILAITSPDVLVDGLVLQGGLVSTYDSDGKLITAIGVDGGASTAPTRISNIQIKNCQFQYAGRCAIYAQYLDSFVFENNKATNLGYAGIEVLSCTNGRIHNNSVVTVSPGAGGNAYGIYLSQTNSSDVTRHPVCRKISVDHNYIEDCFWEGLDCHGGEDLSFSFNTVNNCRVGIAIIHSDDEVSTPISGAYRVKVIGNSITDGMHSSSEMAGIVTSQGAEHRDITITSNTIDTIGNAAVTTVAAGVIVGNVSRCSVSSNTITNCANYGVFIRSFASNVAVSSNTFSSIVSNALSSSAVIRIARDAGAAGPVMISNNTLTASLGSFTYKDQYGISVSSGDGGNIRVGVNHFAAATVYPYNIAFSKTNGSSFPVTNFGLATIPVTTSASAASLVVALPVPHSLTSLMSASATISSAAGNTRTLCHVTVDSVTQITIKVYTANGSNFAANGNILVNWQTFGF